MERILTSLAAVTALAFLYQGLFVLFQDPKAQKNRLFFYITLSIAGWNLAFIGLYTADSLSAAAQGVKIARPLWVLLFALNLHFILRVTEQRRLLRSPWFLILLHGSMGILLFRAFQGPFLIDTLQHAGSFWQPVYHLFLPWGILYLLYAFLTLLFPLILLIQYRRKTLNHQKRAQAAGIFISTAAGFTLAAGSDALIAVLDLPLPPVGQLFLLIWLAGIWVVFRRYKLLTISSRAAGAEIIRQIQDYVILLDTQGHIEQINPSFREALQLTPKEILGTKMEIFLFQAASFQRALEQEQKEPGGTSFAADLLGGGGAGKPLSSRVTQIIGRNSRLPLGFSVIARDMRETQYLHRLEDEVRRRKESEEKLQAAKDLAESAAAAKSRFLTTISHELKTPLNGIIGMLSLIQSTHDPDELQDYTNKALESSQTLLTLLDNILHYTRLDQETEHPALRQVALEELLTPLLDSSRSRAEAKGLTFLSEKGPSLPAQVETDPPFLERILSHLLSNAVNFTSEGTITFSARREDNHLVFSIRDTGIGIPLDQQDQIFKAFYQIDGDTNRHYPGAGLGLALAQRLTECLGGIISVNSEPGRGAAFILRLPLTPTLTKEAL